MGTQVERLDGIPHLHNDGIQVRFGTGPYLDRCPEVHQEVLTSTKQIATLQIFLVILCQIRNPHCLTVSESWNRRLRPMELYDSVLFCRIQVLAVPVCM